MRRALRTLRQAHRRWLSYAAVGVLLSGIFLLHAPNARAATLTAPSMSIGDSRPGETGVVYDFETSGVSLSAINCIKLVFATTSSGSTVPTDMDTTAADLDDGATDYVPTPASWTVNASVNGTVEITYATGETPGNAANRNVVLTGIKNGTTVNTPYYVQFTTYANTDCASDAVDNVTASFIFTNGQEVSVTVDPTLSFIVSAVTGAQAVNGSTTTVGTTTSTIPFGAVTPSSNAVAAQDLTVSTNTTNGYTVYLRYTGPLSSGADTLDDHGGTNAAPTAFSAAGTEAFGYTTDDDTLGTGTADRFITDNWAAITTTNTEVAYSPTVASNETTRVGYQVGIEGGTPAGEYTSTVIYTIVPAY